MSTLALATMLLGGCASITSHTSNSAMNHLEQANHKIDASEARCVSEAETSSNWQIENLASGLDSLADPQISSLTEQRDRMIAACKSIATQKREALASNERAEYQAHGDAERNHLPLIMIMAGSGPH
ncbi:MAG TPA: hypothetical protein VMB26_01005 [Candidatus Binataceae bacterium]|nr:hypothetical protein [Candidatus Binataceae bacterium]